MSPQEDAQIDLRQLARDGLRGRLPLPGQLLFITIVLVPLFLFGTGVLKAHSYWQLSREGLRVQAKVLQVDTERISSTSVHYHPIVRFQDQEGKTHEYRSGTRYTGKPPQIGDKITILYDPRNPSRMVTASSGNYTIPAIYVVVGILLGGLLLWLYRKAP